MTLVQGYVVPWRQESRSVLDGEPTSFAPGAFDDFLSNEHDVYLCHDSHDAPAIARGVKLWRDDYGLAFEASLSEKAWVGIRRSMCGSHTRVSGLFHFDETERVEHRDYVETRVTKASLEHVAIVSRAAFQNTGAWSPEINGEMPPRLQTLRDRWLAGRRSDLARQSNVAAFSARSLGGQTIEMPINPKIVNALVAQMSAVKPRAGKPVVFGLPKAYRIEAASLARKNVR